jgi:hypothetical protein
MRGQPPVDQFRRVIQLISEGERYVLVSVVVLH